MALPRSKIARLIDHLSDDGAKVIAFDVGFLQQDETNNLHFIQQPESKINIGSLQLESGQFEMLLRESTLMADNDLLLANAIKCGMVQRLEGLNKKRLRQRKQPLGIGTTTNPVVVGNMRSEKLFDYTVKGGSVNFGSRLTGAKKNYKI
jgi:class 3 adenylate cyclase